MMLDAQKYLLLLLLLAPLLLTTACGDDDDDNPEPTPTYAEFLITPQASAANNAQLVFLDMDNKTIVEFEAGTFDFTNTLSIDGKDSIIVRGAGRNETILDFANQTAGGEGMLVTNCNYIRFENLTIRDAVGDALKTRNCDYVSFDNIATIWSGDPSADNGAYGLYPVLCEHVYINNCYAYGASDAGIYVGQSDQVIVKNSVAEGNVAGIEIENTTNADVFDNEAFDNTGGILVFDLPGLTKYGKNCRVFNNNCHDNNRINFAPEGNIVANVPAGTGCMILSTQNIEIFDNDFIENNFAGVMVDNYLIINEVTNDPNFEPYPSGVYIHDNNYVMTGIGQAATLDQPTFVVGIILAMGLQGINLPNILTDGLLNEDALCIQEDSEVSFVNLNIDEAEDASLLDTELAPFDCTKDRLDEINFTEY